MIKKWDRIIAKMKSKFMPKEYQISLDRQVQTLKQRMMIVNEYTEEFYKIKLRVGYVEDTPDKTKIFVNDQRIEMLYAINILSLKI